MPKRPTFRVYNNTIQEYFDHLISSHPKPKFSVAFADVPDNIGLKYDGVNDKLPIDEYTHLLHTTIAFAQFCPVWISFNTRWLPLMGQLSAKFPVSVHPCVQTITFGAHQKARTKLTDCQRPLWLFVPQYMKRWKFEKYHIPSVRQELGDDRAEATGKMPPNVFDFVRVVHNDKQRRPWHPTQLNEGLVERALRLTAPDHSRVLDLFSGTGTTAIVSKRLKLSCVSVEASAEYAYRISLPLGVDVETV